MKKETNSKKDDFLKRKILWDIDKQLGTGVVFWPIIAAGRQEGEKEALTVDMVPVLLANTTVDTKDTMEMIHAHCEDWGLDFDMLFHGGNILLGKASISSKWVKKWVMSKIALLID